MIKNIRKIIKVYCGNDHDELQELQLGDGIYQMFFACPRYHIENRDPNERACNNRISIDDYENMVTYISKLIEDAEMNGQVINLKNYKWTKKNIEFKIIEHTKNSIKVLMKNKVAINK